MCRLWKIHYVSRFCVDQELHSLRTTFQGWPKTRCAKAPHERFIAVSKPCPKCVSEQAPSSDDSSDSQIGEVVHGAKEIAEAAIRVIHQTHINGLYVCYACWETFTKSKDYTRHKKLHGGEEDISFYDKQNYGKRFASFARADALARYLTSEAGLLRLRSIQLNSKKLRVEQFAKEASARCLVDLQAIPRLEGFPYLSTRETVHILEQERAVIRVENIHSNISESDIEDIFTRIGPIVGLSLPCNVAGQSTGIAFVTYSTEEDACAAVARFNGSIANGQPIHLTIVPSRTVSRPQSTIDRYRRSFEDWETVRMSIDRKSGVPKKSDMDEPTSLSGRPEDAKRDDDINETDREAAQEDRNSMEPSGRRFQALNAGHKSLEDWPKVASRIKDNYRYILGMGNPGVIQLLADSKVAPNHDLLDSQSPAICITCRYPEKVSRSNLTQFLGPLHGLPIVIGRGGIRRSVFADNGSDIVLDNFNEYPEEARNPLVAAFERGPACYGHYMQRPDCGASLGVQGISGLESGRVSLGGHILLLKRDRWEQYALTCHHLLECSCQDISCVQGQHVGVQENVFDYHGSRTRPRVSSPAKADYEGEIARLVQRLQILRAHPLAASVEVPQKQLEQDLIWLKKARQEYGHIMQSSGCCVDERHSLQMDWLLIGQIPADRIGANNVGDAAAFMEGLSRSRGLTDHVPTEHLSKDDFESLISLCQHTSANTIGFLSRIHGRGCESGLRDGHLSRATAVVCMDGLEATEEWCFAPREGRGLGIAGDSGAWIFTETGRLLGQIWGHDPFTQMTYYTPIWALFDHIKRITGATDIKLPPPEPSGARDSGYASISRADSREQILKDEEVPPLPALTALEDSLSSIDSSGVGPGEDLSNRTWICD